MMTKGREANPDQVMPHVVHPGIHQDYDLDFWMWRVDDIAPTLTSPMLAGIASSTHLTGRPAVPKGPASPKTEEGLWGRGGAPAQPAVPGPSHIGGPVETEGDKPLEQEAIDLDVTILAFTSEDTAAVVISDGEVTSFPGGWPEAVSTPKLEVTWGHKRPSEDTSPCSSPRKKQATEELEGSPPPHEAALLRGMMEKDILPKRYEVFTLDYDWMQSVRGSLLGLEAGTLSSRRDIDNSSHFVPRTVASETELPEVITGHWLPILRREGLLMECPQTSSPPQWTGSLRIPVRVSRSTSLLHSQLFQARAY